MIDLEKKIRDEYVRFVQENGKRPASGSQLMESIGEKPDDFHKYYHSFAELDKLIWKEYFDTTKDQMMAEPAFEEYPVGNKMLSFCYTLIEVMKHERDYVVFCFKNAENFILTPDFLQFFEQNFDLLSDAFILEGTDTGQIVARPFLSDHYGKLFWAEMLFILRFWVNDTSAEYERTDAAIEKSVAFIFDFMEEGIFDTAFDFGKFLLFGK